MTMRLAAAVLLLVAVPAGAQTGSFPEIRPGQSVTISLSRTACFGACPVYALDIDAKGAVTFNGEKFVAVTGKHRGLIAAEDFTSLVDEFRAADFFALQNAYRAPVTDLPTTTIAIAVGRQRKSVTDYGGSRAGMPASVRALEDRIDALAGTEKWVKGNDQTVAALTAEGWDFETHREANLRLISAMSHDGNLVLQLLAAGVPTDSDYGCAGLMKAVAARDFATAYLLVRAHVPFVVETAREYGGARCDVPGAAVDGGDLIGVAWLLRHAADASEHDRQGVSLLMRAKGAADMVKLLLSDGADPNARDAKGQTALMQAGAWPDVVALLLGHGADGNIKDSQGRTALELYPPGSPAAQLLTEWRQAHAK